jgi:hypothetical protein
MRRVVTRVRDCESRRRTATQGMRDEGGREGTGTSRRKPVQGVRRPGPRRASRRGRTRQDIRHSAERTRQWSTARRLVSMVENMEEPGRCSAPSVAS